MTKQSSEARDPAPSAGTDTTQLDVQAHIYGGGRCIFCNVNHLDEDLYGPFECVKRERSTYSTETPRADSLDLY